MTSDERLFREERLLSVMNMSAAKQQIKLDR